MLDHNPMMEEYCKRYTSHLPNILRELSEETYDKTSQPRMLSGELQGSFLRLLTALIGAKSILEIGTFTGYSAICMALELPEDGQLVTLESDRSMQYFHEKYFPKAGISNKIRVIYGNARETIHTANGPWDLVFIDADKKGYAYYYDQVIEKVRPGGLIVADNVLWSGRVYAPDDENTDQNTLALRAFNEKVAADERVSSFLLYLRDGLMILRKIS